METRLVLIEGGRVWFGWRGLATTVRLPAAWRPCWRDTPTFSSSQTEISGDAVGMVITCGVGNEKKVRGFRVLYLAHSRNFRRGEQGRYAHVQLAF